VAPYNNIIEFGTPLLKSEGLFWELKDESAFPDKLVWQFFKTADAGNGSSMALVLRLDYCYHMGKTSGDSTIAGSGLSSKRTW